MECRCACICMCHTAARLNVGAACNPARLRACPAHAARGTRLKHLPLPVLQALKKMCRMLMAYVLSTYSPASAPLQTLHAVHQLHVWQPWRLPFPRSGAGSDPVGDCSGSKTHLRRS
eukprot:362977-Chlamydomonas_euryale.AAC.3